MNQRKCSFGGRLLFGPDHEQLPFFAVLESKRVRHHSTTIDTSPGLPSRDGFQEPMDSLESGNRAPAAGQEQEDNEILPPPEERPPCRTSTRMRWRHGSTTGRDAHE